MKKSYIYGQLIDLVECNIQGRFVDGSVRRIRKTSSEIIPKQLRTKHATLEFLFAY